MSKSPGKLISVLLILAAVWGVTGCSQSDMNSMLSGKKDYWVIVLKRFVGERNYEASRLVSKSIRDLPQLDEDEIKIYRQKDQAILTYGRYDEPDTREAKQDLTFVKQLAVPDKGFLFLEAHMEPVPQPDPKIPQGWYLSNNRGHWTLQVARFDGPGRKQAAVKMLEKLRNEGRQAYVRHGYLISTVTIGSFGRDAVEARRMRSKQFNKPLIMTKPVPVDPRLKRLKKEFPYLLINGAYIDLKSAEEKAGEKRMKSKLMRVPDSSGSLW